MIIPATSIATTITTLVTQSTQSKGVGLHTEVEKPMEVLPGWLHLERALRLLAFHWLEIILASQNKITLYVKHPVP